MAGLGEAAAIIGVVAFGMQTAQMLQDEIDAVRSADQRVQQMVIEIQATAHFLKDLQQYLAPGSRISRQRRREYELVIHQCNIVFRRVITLIAKAGSKVLAAVDDYQRRIRQGADPKTLELHVQLCRLESLSWLWKMKKIEQCIADLDRLKRGLNDRLTIAHTAQAEGRPLDEDFDGNEGEGEGREDFDLISTVLPSVDVIEQEDDDAPSGTGTDWFSGDFLRRRKRASDYPSIVEEVSYSDHAGSEPSSHYDTDSDSSRSVDVRKERSRRRRTKGRRHRVHRGEEGEVVMISYRSCTIS